MLDTIKEKVRKYCKENIAHVPYSSYYEKLREANKITSFFQLPEDWQKQVKIFIKRFEKKYGKVEKILLVGSLSSGSGIIPGKTTEEFIEARKRYSLKTRKNKSDIDLYIYTEKSGGGREELTSEIVNIESLPHIFPPFEIIYENGNYV